MTNVHCLISDNHESHRFTATDLYILALVIVFHDVGNLFDRDNHHLKIGSVYDWARGENADVRREKTLVIRAAQAHTGMTSAGDRNTLSEIDPTDHFDGAPVQLRHIAAVLRLADELAEGPQRTTDFFRTQIGYDQNSRIFHQYAACTNVAADRANERIRLTYEIQLTDFSSGDLAARCSSLASFLTFLLNRVGKLDDERRYARFYCRVLEPFKQTDVAINFTNGDRILPTNVRFQLDDLVIPGAQSSSFEARFAGKCKPPAGLADEVFATAENGGQTP